MSTPKAKKPSVPKPSREPQHLSDADAWYYEARRGIQVIVETRTPAGEVIVRHVDIPWGKLMASAKRCGKA